MAGRTLLIVGLTAMLVGPLIKGRLHSVVPQVVPP
jgi:hypothetical protein